MSDMQMKNKWIGALVFYEVMQKAYFVDLLCMINLLFNKENFRYFKYSRQ
jgi:hypothetical protein